MVERQTALVTGGTRGLGRAIAERLLEDGYDVAICGRRLPEMPVAAGGREAVAFAADVRDAAAAETLIGQVVDHFGGLSLLVNNAGGSPEVSVADSSASLIEKVVALNLLAPLFLCRAALGALTAAKGSVVNIASISGRRAAPGTVAYGAAKAGLLNATQGLAMEWAPDVRVNAVVVGLVENPDQAEHYGCADAMARISAIVPMQRMARGSDVAGAVAWLASPEAAYITGTAIEVHGGGEVPAFLTLARSEA